MAGVRAYRTRTGSPTIESKYIRASQDIKYGDIIVGCTDITTERVKAATSVELPTATNGWLGFAKHGVKLDSTGQLVQSVPSTVDTGAAVIHPVPSFSRLLHTGGRPLIGTTPDIGNYQLEVVCFTDDLEILIDVCSNSGNTTVTQALEGKAYGLIIDVGDLAYKLDVANTTQNGAVVVKVDTKQPNFNVSADTNNAVWVRIKPAYQQYITGLLYA